MTAQEGALHIARSVFTDYTGRCIWTDFIDNLSSKPVDFLFDFEVSPGRGIEEFKSDHNQPLTLNGHDVSTATGEEVVLFFQIGKEFFIHLIPPKLLHEAVEPAEMGFNAAFGVKGVVSGIEHEGPITGLGQEQ